MTKEEKEKALEALTKIMADGDDDAEETALKKIVLGAALGVAHDLTRIADALEERNRLLQAYGLKPPATV